MATRPMPLAGGARKHRKTLTGCWTCRSRKVKCDEARPACLQCCSKSLHCEGYVVRLQWMPPDQSMSTSRELPRTKVQRRLVTTEPVGQALDSCEIDGILGAIDAYESVNHPVFIQNFGVFESSAPSPEASAHTHSPSTSVSKEESASASRDPPFAGVESSQEIGINRFCANVSSEPDQLVLDPAEPYPNLGGDNDFLQTELDSEAIAELTSAWLKAIHPSPPEPPELEEMVVGTIPNHLWEAPGVLIRSPASSTLSEQEQFLMHHYSHHAVNLFCVIDNRKSPWKTIHLPRAIQSVGQLTVSGSSTAIRNALRNALLSISAFYLSNENKARDCHENATSWSRKAAALRAKAIELLKEAVNNEIKDKTVPKYKEFLATMLSMITINVMSGDTSTCGLHLDGAFRFMTQARTWKKRFSPKARALHRIYFYLQVIHESTAVTRSAGSPFSVQRPPALPSSDLLDLEGVSEPPTDAPVTGSRLQMSTYECIYGVPENLLILLSKTTKLIHEVTSFRARNPTSALPDDVARCCDSLERTIMDWPMKQELERCRIDGLGASSEIIRHTTYAFHNALIIYFAQNIRLLSYRYLQPFVETVLENVEAIEKIKATSNILAAPLYWPSFIAASEAFHEPLQERFKNWYERDRIYGIEAARSGMNVLTRVWALGPTMTGDRTSRWRMVVKEMDANLMLS